MYNDLILKNKLNNYDTTTYNNNNNNNSNTNTNNSNKNKNNTATENNTSNNSKEIKIDKYPSPCKAVSTLFIHGIFSQGTEYSFFLPPQPENKLLGKRVRFLLFLVFILIHSLLELFFLVE